MKHLIVKQPYRWYALYVKYKMEKVASKELQQRGIEAYLPLKHVKRQWSDRVKVLEEPLIWGYIFVRVSHKEYYDALMASGVLRYVCFEGKAEPIPDLQIQNLKKFVDFANESIVITSGHIAKGQGVKVSSGALKGTIGEVLELRGSKRLLIRFGNLGCCVHVELGVNNIELLESKRTRSCFSLPQP
nr:UpxY family transcription antiterminator [uncultured Draconibacterium sp.]